MPVAVIHHEVVGLDVGNARKLKLGIVARVEPAAAVKVHRNSPGTVAVAYDFLEPRGGIRRAALEPRRNRHRLVVRRVKLGRQRAAANVNGSAEAVNRNSAAGSAETSVGRAGHAGSRARLIKAVGGTSGRT